MAIGVDQRGFHIEPLHNTGTGEKKTSWYLQTEDLADIRDGAYVFEAVETPGSEEFMRVLARIIFEHLA